MVGFGLLFFVALIRRRIWLAAIWFVLCLATREDAGFHLFALLGLTMLYNFKLRGALYPHKRLAIFSGFSLVYSIFAVALQHALLAHANAFAAVYWGSSPLQKIFSQETLRRLQFCLVYRSYLWLPAYICLFWAVRSRCAFLLFGFLAFIPWIALQLFAARILAGTLSNYYSFPLIFALLWPLIAISFYENAAVSMQYPLRRNSLTWFAAMLLALFVGVTMQQNPGGIDFPGSFVRPPSAGVEAATDRAIAILAAHPAAFGHAVFDAGVISLAPNHYRQSELADSSQSRPVDMIAYFHDGYQRDVVAAVARQWKLDDVYRIPNTQI